MISCLYRFTPDFTMSRIRRSLTIYSSLGIPVNYTLQATIPSFMLSKCAAALPRPPWEPILYYSTMCLMGFLLFGVMVASYIEADRHFTADIIKRRVLSSLTFDKTKVFDLNQIATSVKADINTSTATSSHNGKPANPQKSSETEVNGHVHPSRKKPESTLSSIFILCLIKNLFSRWNIRRDRNSNSSGTSSSRKSPDRQCSAEKETSKTSTTTTTPHNTKQHTMTDTTKSGMTAEGTLVSDNKINPYAVSKPFKKKMTKQQQHQQQQRQQTDLNSDVGPVATSEKKQGNKSNSTLTTNNNNTIQRKLSSDNSEPKEKASTSSSASHRRSTGADHPDNDATSNATENNATKPESKCSKLSYQLLSVSKNTCAIGILHILAEDTSHGRVLMVL